MDFRADLHCHTTCSDGTLTPEALVDHAVEIGLSGLSITDHDTIDAYLTAIPAARQRGLPLVYGVEFSCSHKGVSVHILGYAFSLTHPAINALSEAHIERRTTRNQLVLELLAKKGMVLEPEEILGSHRPGRPHIALAMVKKGYVESIEQAFHLYLGDGKPCFVQGKTFSVEESIDVIHQSGGLAVIAHPHLMKDQPTMLDLLKMDFDGIEAYYARFLPHHHERWVKIAKQKKWLITGGSDFHGTNKTQNLLGSSWVDEETFRYLLNHQLSHV